MSTPRGRSSLSVHYDGETLKRQEMFNVCCQSCEQHRFDCQEAPMHQRSGGPYMIRRVGR